jgi:hypothetical protein
VSCGTPGTGFPLEAKAPAVNAEANRVVTRNVADIAAMICRFGFHCFPFIEVRLIISFKELLFFDTKDLSFLINESLTNKEPIITMCVTFFSDSYDKNCTDTRKFGLI